MCRGRIIHQFDAGDAGIGQALEFASIGDAIAVRILPHAELGEIDIGCIQHAILVAVIIGCQTFKVGQAVTAKDDFRTIIDQAVAVAVNGKQAIVSADPCGAFWITVTGIVKGNASGRRQELRAVTIKIEDNRRNSRSDQRGKVANRNTLQLNKNVG